jgi:hypothetical protein
MNRLSHDLVSYYIAKFVHFTNEDVSTTVFGYRRPPTRPDEAGPGFAISVL